MYIRRFAALDFTFNIWYNASNGEEVGKPYHSLCCLIYSANGGWFVRWGLNGLPFLTIKEGRADHDNGKGKKLTPKMMEFIDLYMIHFNGTKAVELSSYKTKNPANFSVMLLQHPLVQQEISRRLTLRSEKAEIKAEYLLAKLMSIIDRTEEDNPQAALRAIELAGKSIALWKERQEISGPDGAAIQHEQHVKESVADFTSRITSLVKRSGTDNVVEFPNGSGTSRA